MNVLQLLISGLLGGGFVGLIEFLIRRHDEKADKNSEILKRLDDIEQKIESLEEKSDERDALNSRVRILRFLDELLEGRRHTKDSFDQCMSDITSYEHYCENHSDFKNNQTEATVTHIKKIYAERLEHNDFL